MTASYVYEFMDADGALLYVGCTGNIAQRLTQHAGDKDWWGDVAHVVVDRFPSREIGLAEERARIEAGSPKHNTIYTDRYNAGGWDGRRARQAEAHAAGELCHDGACRACRDAAHERGFTCGSGSYFARCQVCRSADYRPYWELLGDEAAS